MIKQFASQRGEDYDVRADFSVDAISYAVYSLVLLYEMQPNALGSKHHESWYNINIWGLIIDKAFGDMKGVDIVRGESCSVASGDRKNKNQKRQPTNRKSIG